MSVAVDQRGRILVSDSELNSIQIYDYSGKPLLKVGSPGTGDGQFYHQSNICVDRYDNIVVADTYNNRVSMFSPDGRFMQHILTVDYGGIQSPRGVALDRTGQLAVTLWEDSKLQLYQVITL